MLSAKELYETRKNRVLTAIRNEEPDRVPNALLTGTYPLFKAGISGAESMVEHEKVCQAVLGFYEKHPQFDCADISLFLTPSKVLESLGVKTARWPGDPKGLDEDNTYQFIEFPTMMEDEYDELIDHPAEFFYTKLLPRTMEVFEPLADVDYHALVTMPQMVVALPEQIPMYRRLLDAAEENARTDAIIAEYNVKMRELGFYSIAGGGSATAFDMIGDTLRGTMDYMPDLLEQRDKVKHLIDIFADVHLATSIQQSRAMGSDYAWVMLHKGFDGFISDTDYAELYWPSLKKWILGLIDAGITPVVYTEGAYTTRLKYLQDVPPNKVIYNFEDVDMRVTKQMLGGTATIMGCYPAFTLRYGTPQDVVEKLKEVLDALAPGGGYIFNTGYSIEDCPEENLETLLEALDEYGKY